MKETAQEKPKKEEKVSRNKETIFRVAMELFLAKGYDATTTNDICAAAGITKPTLYYYAKSKRHLFYLLHMETIDKDLKPHLEKVSAITDPLERLEQMIKGYAEIMCLRPELRILIHETLAIKDNYFREVRRMWKSHYYLLRNTIAELQKDGIILNKAKPSRLALLLLGMLTWITFWFDYNRKEEAGEIASTAVDLVFKGLSVNPVVEPCPETCSTTRSPGIIPPKIS
jgi:AcrR family transcriptional regulator